MGSASGIRAGKAYVEIGANDSRLVAGLKAAQKKLHAFGLGLSKVGAGLAGASASVLGPLSAAVAVFASSGDELSKMSNRTGASVEALSELRHAANQSDVASSDLQAGLVKMNKTLGEAATGSSSANEAISQIGLSIGQLQGLAPDKQFELLSEAIANVEDPALRTKAVMDIFGKSGANLLPLMIDGAKGIQTLREEARQLGLQVSSKDAAAATLFGDTLSNLWTVVKDVAFEIGAALAPVLTQILQAIIPVVVAVANWISQNRQLVVWIAGIAAAVGAAGAALIGLGITATVVAAGIGGLLTVASAIGTAIAAIASPVGLAIAAFVSLGAVIATQTEWGASMVAWFGDVFGQLFGTIQTTIGNIVGLLQAGQFGAAMELAWTAVDAAWQSGIAGLMNAWTTFKTWILNGWTNAVSSIAKAFNSAWGFVEIAWTETVGFFLDSWTSFTNFLTKTWNNSVGFIQKAWVRLKALFDSDINVQAEVDRINSETQDKNAASDQSTQKILSGRFDKRFQRQVEIDQRSKDIDKNLEQDRQREIADRKAAADAQKAERSAQAAAARAKLDAANREAGAAVAARAAAPQKPGVPSIDDAQAAIGTQFSQAQKTFGTFSAAEAMQLGGGDDIQKKIASTNEQIVENTRKLITEFRDGLRKMFGMGP